MQTRPSGGGRLLIVLSAVVLAQAAALAWLVLISPDRARTLADLRARPVETVVALCTPAKDGEG